MTDGDAAACLTDNNASSSYMLSCECGERCCASLDSFKLVEFQCFHCNKKHDVESLQRLYAEEEVAVAVELARNRLLAFWENALKLSILGEADELAARDDVDDHLQVVIGGLRHIAESDEFEEVVDEIFDEAFAAVVDGKGGERS